MDAYLSKVTFTLCCARSGLVNRRWVGDGVTRTRREDFVLARLPRADSRTIFCSLCSLAMLWSLPMWPLKWKSTTESGPTPTSWVNGLYCTVKYGRNIFSFPFQLYYTLFFIFKNVWFWSWGSTFLFFGRFEAENVLKTFIWHSISIKQRGLDQETSSCL